jgi:hypothetical protein
MEDIHRGGPGPLELPSLEKKIFVGYEHFCFRELTPTADSLFVLILRIATLGGFHPFIWHNDP